MARFLVVDDNESIAELVATAARYAGCDVEVVSAGFAALEAIRTADFDVVILDAHLPDLSGLDVLRSLSGERSSPIIAVYSADDRICEEALRLGAAEFIPKTSFEALIDFIQKHARH